MSDNNKQEVGPLLVQHQKGVAHAKMSEELREAVAAVKEHGKPAEVTIKIKIAPVKGNSRVLQTFVSSTANIPKPAPAPAIYFADDEGGLHRNDPEQREFEYGPDSTTDAVDGKSAAAGRG